MYGPTPYDGQQMPMYNGQPTPMQNNQMLPTPAEPVRVGEPTHGQLMLPPAPAGASLPRGGQQQMMNGQPRMAQRPASSMQPQPTAQQQQQPAAQPQVPQPSKYVRNPSKPFNPTWGEPARPQATATDGLIGPVGYDAD
jgi:hypothetical protein